MKIVLGDSNESNLVRIIKLSAVTGNRIVCAEGEFLSKVIQMAEELELEIPKPMNYKIFLSGNYPIGGTQGFLIHDLREFLSRITPNNVDAFSMELTPDVILSYPNEFDSSVIDGQFKLIEAANSIFKGCEASPIDASELLKNYPNTPSVPGMR